VKAISFSFCARLLLLIFFAAQSSAQSLSPSQEQTQQQRDDQEILPNGISRSALNAGPEYVKSIRAAATSFASRDFEAALRHLTDADKIKPGLPDADDVRAAVYAEQHRFDLARELLGKVLKSHPDYFWPKFNLAEILLMEKKPAEARAAFKKLPKLSGEVGEVIEFKIMLTYLLEGNDANAKEVLDHIKFPGDSAAYYFAHAAWDFAHNDPGKARGWMNSGLRIFGMTRCYSLYDTLVDMGWVEPRGAAK